MLEFLDYAGDPSLTAFFLFLLLLFDLGKVLLAQFGLGGNDAVGHVILQAVEYDERSVAGDDGVLLAQFGDFILMLVRAQFQLGDFLLCPDAPRKTAVRGLDLSVKGDLLGMKYFSALTEFQGY